MSQAVVVTISQSKALEILVNNGAVSATDFDRSTFESLVSRRLATKHQNGHSVTYSISTYGRIIYKSLGGSRD